MSQHEPAFNIPEPAPVRFAGLLVFIHVLVVFSALGRSAFAGNLGVLRPIPYTDGLGWLSAGGHGFFHASWAHVLTNSAMLVIFAIPTIRAARALAVRKGRGASGNPAWLAIFMFGVIAGAFAQWGWWGVSDALGWVDASGQSAVGASGGVSALFASAGWAMGGRAMMLRFGAAWALINLLFVAFEGILGFGLAWPAHLGGFLGGMVLGPILCAAPGEARS